MKFFFKRPHHILNNISGCKQCYIIQSRLRLGRTQEEFIKLACEIHNNKYDYSLVTYVNNITKVEIILSYT